MDRHEFENWARSSGRIVEESETAYTIELFGDSKIVCPKSDTSVTTCIARDFMWESWISAFMLRELNPSTLFVDVGANCGYYSVLASHRGAKVFSIEPNPNYIPLLMETSTFQHSPFEVIHAAMSDQEGLLNLRVPGTLEGSATIRQDADFSGHDEYSIEVPAATLDTLDIPCEGNVIVKIDAESAEEMIWDGALKFMEKHSPTFVIEYTPGAYSDSFTDKLKAYGEISYIDFQGAEVPLLVNTLSELTDWAMLVVRKRN